MALARMSLVGELRALALVRVSLVGKLRALALVKVSLVGKLRALALPVGAIPPALRVIAGALGVTVRVLAATASAVRAVAGAMGRDCGCRGVCAKRLGGPQRRALGTSAPTARKTRAWAMAGASGRFPTGGCQLRGFFHATIMDAENSGPAQTL
jgi:hypothetical protein